MKKSTSLKAWEKTLKELPRRQMQVFEKIFDNPGITIRETAHKLKTFPHCLSGRFSELEDKGIIKVSGEKKFKGESQPHSMYKIVKK
jgi:predicted transcriptional regulator